MIEQSVEIAQESFVSRLFGRDLDSGSWFVEFIDMTAGSEADEEAYRAEDEEGPRDFYGLDEEAVDQSENDDDEAGHGPSLVWSSKRRR